MTNYDEMGGSDNQFPFPRPHHAPPGNSRGVNPWLLHLLLCLHKLSELHLLYMAAQAHDTEECILLLSHSTATISATINDLERTYIEVIAELDMRGLDRRMQITAGATPASLCERAPEVVRDLRALRAARAEGVKARIPGMALRLLVRIQNRLVRIKVRIVQGPREYAAFPDEADDDPDDR